MRSPFVEDAEVVDGYVPINFDRQPEYSNPFQKVDEFSEYELEDEPEFESIGDAPFFENEYQAGDKIYFPSKEYLLVIKNKTGVNEEHWDSDKTGNPLLDTSGINQNKYLSKNFQVKEFAKHSQSEARIDIKLVEALQKIRDSINKSLIITSGYRSYLYNKDLYDGYIRKWEEASAKGENVGKKPVWTPKSRHISGSAVDFKVDGLNGKELAKKVIDILGCGNYGIGLGVNFIHLDVFRDQFTIWNYGKVSDSWLPEIKLYYKNCKENSSFLRTPQSTPVSSPERNWSEAIRLNRIYSNDLGWGKYIETINNFLLPFTGFTNVSLNEENIARAVLNWQKSVGFSERNIDGVIGPDTWKIMFPLLKIPINRIDTSNQSQQVPAGFDKRTYGNFKGLRKSGSGFPRVDDYLIQLSNQGKISISNDEIDLLQRIANVEASGHITAFNSYDRAVVSIGFMQFTLHVGKIQEWIKLNPLPWKKYGIELDTSNRYFDKFDGIKGVGFNEIDKLRWGIWATSFFNASTNEEIIISQVSLAKQYLQRHIIGLKSRLKNDSFYNRFIEDYYKKDKYIRALFQASYNNNPVRATKCVNETLNKVKSNTSIPNFISLYTAILNTVNENRWQRLVKETTKGMKLPENEFVANDEFYQFNSNIETLNLIAENNFTNSSHALENQTIENDYDYFEDEAKRLSYGQGQLNRKDIFPFLPGLTNNEFNNKNWYKNIVPGTFLNLKIKGGIHVVLQRKLHEAERWLEAQPKYSGMSHSQIAKELGLNAKTAFSGARISPAKQAMHGFGLAVDIDVFGNPWIGAGWVKHDPVFLKERYRMLSVLKIASGQNLQDKNIFEYLHSISVSAGTETMTAYSILKEKNDQFVHHLKSNPEELKYWTKSQTFGKRNPLKGFLNLHQDLVFALRQVAGLAWGAIDFGPKASGDIMHFDMRTLGVGKFLCEKIKGYVPKSGHPEIQNEYEYEYEMMDTNVDNYMGESIELHEAVEEEEWEDESFMNDDFYFESYNNIDTFENDSEYENQYENDEFLENEEDFFEQESQYEDFDLEYEYEDHESYDEYLIKDISKAVMDNRYYKRVLGWGLHYDQINKILLPYSGQSNISLAESDFAIALSKWQASKGFAPNEADGVLGPHTWNKLETQLNIKTSTGFEPSINSSVSPVSDPVISSEFSNQRKQPVTGNLVAHYGIDIVDSVRSKTLGKTVVSATDGKISSIKYKSDGNGAGNRIHIIDDAGYKHSYFHLSDHNFGINLSSGGRVTKGQKIGEIGNTGRSSGPHLHYETVHPNGTKMNPRLINAGLRMAPNKHEVREFEYEYEFEYS